MVSPITIFTELKESKNESQTIIKTDNQPKQIQCKTIIKRENFKE